MVQFRGLPDQPRMEVASGFVASQPGSLDELACADTVIVIGPEDIDAAPPARRVEALHRARRRSARIVGICSGAFVLARAGLLDGYRATTHWMHVEQFASAFRGVDLDPSVLYVEDRGMFTSAGTAAAVDLCLELVRQDFGAAAANEMAPAGW